MRTSRLFVGLACAVVLSMGAVGAQEATTPDVERNPAGYLTDAEGRSLYIYLRDAQGASTCYDQCAVNWPPVVADGEPSAGEGVVDALLGISEREDGTTQLTFDGWPLYHHARDDEAGEVHGHRMGGVFYLVNSAGARIDAAVEPVEETAEGGADGEGGATAEELEPQMEQGEAIFAANCAACHGAQGLGGVGPTLAGNEQLDRREHVLTTIINGRPDHGMPPFGDQLSDEEIAAVATYVRNAFENDFGPVTPEQVSERR